jgi:hypothetical protein
MLSSSRHTPRIWSRSVAALFAGVLLSQLAAPSAEAVSPPANDLFSNAKHISVGFAETLDTRGATTDATDKAANAECGAPHTAASVWYRIAPSADRTVVLNSKGSTYSVGFIVVTGPPDAFVIQSCGPQSIRFDAHAGTVYFILVFDDQFDGGGNGGSLHFATKFGPPPPSVSVTVNPIAELDRQSHGVIVSGTFTCANASDVIMRVVVKQLAGRVTLTGTKAV